MITNWDFVEAALKTVIKDNVKHLGDAITLETAIEEAISKLKRG